MTHRKRLLAAGAVLAAGAAGGVSIAATSSSADQSPRATSDHTHAELAPLNNSGVFGESDVNVVDGNVIEVSLTANHLLRGLPHAAHIHFGKQATNECPTVRDDHNHDHRLNTAEGVPEYGPVRVSLTTKGDTSPKSTLAVNRYETAKRGDIDYSRSGIKVSPRVLRGIRAGKAVVVIHGIDYNHNGTYDFSAGRSELDPSLPAEATDPVSCGVLKLVP
jgi:hypothetical protein